MRWPDGRCRAAAARGFGEAGTPFEQEKDPLIKRETLELVRAYYKIRESPRAQAHLRDGQGRGRRQPCRGAGRPQGPLSAEGRGSWAQGTAL